MKIGTKMEERIMKKNVFMGLVVVLGLIGCTRNQEIDIQENGLTLVARTESPAESRTVVESGVHVYWEPGDEIAVFMGEKSANFTTDITAASGTATFKGTFGDTTWPEEPDLWAVYPYSEEATFDGETITTVLPSEQVAREGSFGKDMNLSIAHSTSASLQFYNVGGGIRFSVTEEGIKKVMFEGLSGEIISGKVKIGLDENGKPVVQEVTGGSQFITLLPPAGKETFEPGAWYYIVAIPGSLEGGYKLRFYKDSDYARKVSEKKVEIKRSTFGNIEKADEGIEYEATTTHFPVTEKEMKESNQIAMDIASSISHLVQDYENLKPQELAESINAIDGVLEAELNEDESAIIIMQKDSTYINYLLKYDKVGYPVVPESTNSTSMGTTAPIAKSQSIYKSSIHNQEGMVIPSNKSAVIIIPFYNSDDSNGGEQSGFGVNDSFIAQALHAAGYTLDIPITDTKATLEKFDINNLCKYGIVIIRTHGVANAKTNHGERTTALVTRERIENESFFEYLFPKWRELSRCIINDNQIYYASTVPWMEDCATSSTRFQNSLVFAGDCQGMMNDDLRKCFFRYGAAACCGFSDSVAHGTANFAMYRFFNLLAAGTGLHYAHSNSVYSQDAEDYENYKQKSNPNDLFRRSLFQCYLNPSGNYTDLYLNDLSPKYLKSRLEGQSVYLEWQSDGVRNLGITEIDNYESGFRMPYLKLELRYSVFIDGNNVARDITGNSITINDLDVGEYSWYVISEVMDDGEICDTFRADGEDFTVSGLPSASIQTNDPTNIGPCSAEIPFSISTDENVYGYGIVYSTNISNPTADNHGDGNYIMPVSSDVGNSIVISTLTPNTTYYARAFITLNEENGIKLYGNTIQFTTKGLSFNSQYEDLGLSVKWATCNLGSSTPNNVGGFYRWGETSVGSSSNEKYKWGVFPNYTKYNASDGKTTLEASDDAAHVNLGEKWRMPTNDELTELRNSCTWTQTIKNGVRGCTVTGPNGNSIFIPISGGNKGYYHADVLSSSLSINPDDASRYVHALSYAYDENFVYFLRTYRDGGTPIRPVYDDGTQIPHVSFSPSSYAFGNVSVGETATSQAFTFTNSGNATLNVTVESCPDGFATSPNVGGSFPVKAGDSRTGFVIRFSPKQAKSYSGTVVLSTNDPNNPHLYISVSGRGVSSQASEPLISVSPDSYDFGSVTVGQYVRTTITIKNTGTADLEVNSIRLLDGSKGFELGTTASAGTVAPGDTKSFGVRFLPQSKGYAADQILIKSNASINSSKLVTLTGTGI